MDRLSFLLCVGTLLFLSGCTIEDSGDVNQDRIWTRYELFYDANSDKTLVAAQFRYGGSTGKVLVLNEQASVRFNDEDLHYNQSYMAHIREFNSRIDSGAFTYTDLDQLTFTNIAVLPDTIGFPDGLDTIYRSHDNVLQWVGPPLDAAEHVSVFIGNWRWGDVPFFTESEQDATSITLEAGLVAVYPLGSTLLYMDRWTERNAQQSTSKGGKVVGRYRGINRIIEIVN